ncbi:MAG: arginase [Chlamydiales bacterium]|nr:formimidoylglutamase [Chlamydiales bacterium]NCF70441.1 arginase [Chlamydiales bacterium]
MDPRFKDIIHYKIQENTRVIILGFPSDLGVGINGGRPGAKLAPNAIRQELYKLTPSTREYSRHLDIFEGVCDLGDLNIDQVHLEKDQALLASHIASFLKKDYFVILLGGGHELSYGHFLAYQSLKRDIEIINWDAHADVRELKSGKAHSGSPFRQAIEEPYSVLKRYHVLGLEDHCFSKEHLDYLHKHQARLHFADELKDNHLEVYQEVDTSSAMVTFDLDVVNQAYAPGVSAPNPSGISAELYLKAAFNAGKSNKVSSVDFVELNPSFDRDNQSAKLVAKGIWKVLLGLSHR